MTPDEQTLSNNLHSEFGVQRISQFEKAFRKELIESSNHLHSSLKQFKISETLSAHFKDGSMWLRHSQRYGDTEIRPRDMNALVHLWQKHGWQCD